MRLSDVAAVLQGDWVILAQQLDITISEINKIKIDYDNVNDQALAMLHLWVDKNRANATGNELAKALVRINREDVVRKCIYNEQPVEDEVEAAAARVAMDQSGFDTFKEEVGISRDSSIKRGISLDVSYDEQDMIKESESAAEESSSEGENERKREAADQQVTAAAGLIPAQLEQRMAAMEVTPEATGIRDDSLTQWAQEMSRTQPIKFATISEDLGPRDDDAVVAHVDERRHKVSAEDEEALSKAKQLAYIDLVSQMDQMMDLEEGRDRDLTNGQAKHDMIQEDEVHRISHTSEQQDDLFTRMEIMQQQEVSSQQQQAIPEQRDEFDSTPPPSPIERIEEAIISTTKVEEVESRLSQLESELESAYQQQEEPPFETVTDLSSVLPGASHATHQLVSHPAQEVRKDGTVITYTRQISDDGDRFEDIIQEQGPEHETQEVEENEEILPDGTVHHIRKVHSHKVRHVKKQVEVGDGHVEDIYESDEMVPGTEARETIESFQSPARHQVDIEDVDEVLPDGHLVHRHIIHNRMVHHIMTRHESFDSDHGVSEENYEIDEVIPGTETAFYGSDDNLDAIETAADADGAPKHVDYEEKLDDGTIISHRKDIVTNDHYSDLIEEKGPPHDVSEVREEEEILPGGTLHKTHVIHSHKVQHVRRHLESESEDTVLFEGDVNIPGTDRMDMVETYEDREKSQKDIEHVEEMLPGGQVLERDIIHNRMVHHVYTRHESYDREHGHQEEIFEVDEIIPGTESAFLLESKVIDTESVKPQIHVDTLFGESEEVLDDGSVVLHRVLTSEEVHTSRSRSGSLEQETDHIVITEEEYIPSPQRSPLNRSLENLTQAGATAHEIYHGTTEPPEGYIKHTVTGTHLEEIYKDGIVEQTHTTSTETFDRSRGLTDVPETTAERQAEAEVHFDLADAESGTATPVITVTEDLSTPVDEDDYVRHWGIEVKEYDHQDYYDDPPPPEAFAEDRRMVSIDDDDDTAEYDVTEHMEHLGRGIPDHFAQKTGPEYIEPLYEEDSEDGDDVIDHVATKTHKDEGFQEGAEGGSEGDIQSARMVMKKQVHTRTIVRDGQEQTYVTEETRVEQDNGGEPELRDSMQQIIDQFMEGKPAGEGKELLEDDV